MKEAGETSSQSASSTTKSSASPATNAPDPQAFGKGKPLPGKWLPVRAEGGTPTWSGCPQDFSTCFVAWGETSDPAFVELLRDIESVTRYYGATGPNAMAISLDEQNPDAKRRKSLRISFLMQWMDEAQKAGASNLQPGQVALVDATGKVLAYDVYPRNFVEFDKSVAKP